MKYRILAIAILGALCLGGCGNMYDLTQEQNDIIANYAAANLIDRSYYNLSKYVEEYTLPEIPTIDIEQPEETTPSEEETTSEPIVNVNDLFKIEGVDIRYNDYIIVDEYPDNPEAIFSFTPEYGYHFMVLRFSVTNTTDAKLVINTLDNDAIYRVTINSKHKCNNYATLLLNDITNLSNFELEAGEEKEAVMVFMLTDDAVQQMNSAEVSCLDESINVKLKIK